MSESKICFSPPMFEYERIVVSIRFAIILQLIHMLELISVWLYICVNCNPTFSVSIRVPLRVVLPFKLQKVAHNLVEVWVIS